MEATRTDVWIKKLWYIYTVEYYSAIKRNAFEPVLMRWMKLEPIIQSEVSQKEKNKYHILMHTCGIQKDGTDKSVHRAAMETQTDNRHMEKDGEKKERMRCMERATWMHIH